LKKKLKVNFFFLKNKLDAGGSIIDSINNDVNYYIPTKKDYKSENHLMAEKLKIKTYSNHCKILKLFNFKG
jgi:hypothetical protein